MHLRMIKETRSDESGFTILDVMVSIIIMGILTALCVTAMTSMIGSANKERLNAYLPLLGKSMETQSVAHPDASSFTAKDVQIPEELKSKALFVIGTPSDYCVLGTDNSYARKKINEGDFSYTTDGGQQYFIYTPSNSTTTQTKVIEPSLCSSKGPVLMINRGA
jgi:type II secretory pathway pseudopilin PulG